MITGITTALVAVGFTLGLAVLASYGLLTLWWRRPVGRMIVALVGSLTAVQGLSLTSRIWGDFPGRVILILVMYASFVVTLAWMLVQVLREQRDARHEARRRGGRRS